MTSLPPGLIRRSVPVLLDDMLEVHGPDLVRTISQSPHLGRPAEAVDPALPHALQLFFAATKFHTPAHGQGGSQQPGQWAAAMEGAQRNSYETRVADTRARLRRALRKSEVARLVELVGDARSGRMDARDVGAHCAKVVAPLVLPLDGGGEDESDGNGEGEGEHDGNALEDAQGAKELPDEVAYACFDTLTSLPTMFNPLAYVAARRARRCIEQYVHGVLPDAEYPIDYVHNLGAAAQGLGQAIMQIATASGDSGSSSEEQAAAIRAKPVVEFVLRVPLQETTLGGLLPEDRPLVPGKSMVTLFIGEAFTESEDTKFMFGSGTDVRQCPFKDVYLSLMRDMDDGKQ